MLYYRLIYHNTPCQTSRPTSDKIFQPFLQANQNNEPAKNYFKLRQTLQIFAMKLKAKFNQTSRPIVNCQMLSLTDLDRFHIFSKKLLLMTDLSWPVAQMILEQIGAFVMKPDRNKIIRIYYNHYMFVILMLKVT